jgi:hypothetical protein
MYILEEIFGESNVNAMKFAKWTMIISGLLCLAGLAYLFGQISLTQPMDAVFEAPYWAK